MKHLNEVCKLLMDEADQRYELTKSKLEAASLTVSYTHLRAHETPEHLAHSITSSIPSACLFTRLFKHQKLSLKGNCEIFLSGS